jgi:L-idonate 5-dehydrogenase
MRAALIHGAHRLELGEVDVPVAGPGEVRVKVAYVGICGSDLSYYRKGAVGSFEVREPLIPGHEVSGTIDNDPSGSLSVGTPVTIHPATPGTSLPGLESRPNVWPGSRYLGSAMTMPHSQGAMREYLVVRADQVRLLPQSLSLRDAVLAEPLGVGLHAVAIAGDLSGRKVLVSGAGPIGLLAAGAARAKGAAEVWVSDILPEALERARQLGVTGTVDVSSQPLPTETYDVVIEATGVPTAISGALNAAVRGGTVVQVGLVAGGAQPIDLSPVAARELTFRGAFRFIDEIAHAVTMLDAEKSLAQVITHEFSLDDVVAAFDCAADAATSAKVIVRLA